MTRFLIKKVLSRKLFYRPVDPMVKVAFLNDADFSIC